MRLFGDHKVRSSTHKDRREAPCYGKANQFPQVIESNRDTFAVQTPRGMVPDPRVRLTAMLLGERGVHRNSRPVESARFQNGVKEERDGDANTSDSHR